MNDAGSLEAAAGWDAEWQAIPGAFSRLAQRDVQIAAFAIAPQGTALRLRLELEHAK
jgi:pilus assembly protein HofO